jgi:hypothetical protein
VRRSHPDFRTPSDPLFVPIADDVAVDFIDVTSLLDRIELSFFRTRS